MNPQVPFQKSDLFYKSAWPGADPMATSTSRQQEESKRPSEMQSRAHLAGTKIESEISNSRVITESVA
jgi:hypothetical protein